VTIDDRLAIRELAERYALAVDRRDGAALGALFTEDGELHIPRPPESLDPVIQTKGRDAIERGIRVMDRFAATMHAVVGHVIELDADRATGVVSCIAHHVRDGKDVVWALRYHDDYTREPDGWRFTRRSLHIAFLEERPVTAP
jgi:ketosteroid isomerase-like protein